MSNRTGESRVSNTIKNVSAGSLFQVFSMLLSFVSRTVFVKFLGNDYLSCDGLFSNILTLLSFSELGIGSAIIYSLYKPIAEDNKVQIGKLMNLFALAYRYIACFILVGGFCVIPFLNVIITDVPDIKENIILLYVLFLLNTVASYIFGYKRSYLMACQKNYIVLFIYYGVNTFRIIAQIIVLIATRNYVAYLIIMISCTLINNILSTWITDKKYPWLNYFMDNKLSKEERKPIFSNIKSIVQYKLGTVILNGTDNIIISACLKTSLVGICSNYNLIINSVTAVVNQACNGMVASIGNYNVTENRKNRYLIFKRLYTISFWAFGLCSICLAILLTPFISEIWLGEEYELNYSTVLALSLSFYVTSINIIPSSFRTSLGYFKEARYCPTIAAVINIILSILWAKWFGVAGIFWATVVSKLFTYNVIDPYLVFIKGFNMRFIEYMKLFLKQSFVLVIAYCCAYFSTILIDVKGLFGFLIKAVVCFVVANIIFFWACHNDVDLKHLLKRFVKMKG